jgi:flagellin
MYGRIYEPVENQEDFMASIVTNAAANQVILYVNRNTTKQNDLLAELSSGSRVVNAATDPASTATGTKLQSDANVLTQAASNAANMQSVLQTADGALAQISDILTQMKTLASQALSGSADSSTLTNIDTEYQKLLAEITSITTSTKFNGTALIDGSFSASVLVGTSSGDTITVDLSSVNTAIAAGLSISTSSVSSTTNATSALGLLATAINTIAKDRATVGAYTAQFGYSEKVISVAQQNITAAKSTITDADVSQTETDYNNASVLTQAGIAALTKAQTIPQDLLRLLQA